MLVAPPRPGLPTRLGNRELLEPNTPLAVKAGTALARNLASAPGAADTRLAPPTSPPKDPPKVGGGVNDNPNGLGDAVTVPANRMTNVDRANVDTLILQTVSVLEMTGLALSILIYK